MTVAGRGRPLKPYKYYLRGDLVAPDGAKYVISKFNRLDLQAANALPHVGIAEPLSHTQANALRKSLLEIPRVRRLQSLQREGLVREVIERAPFCVVARNIQGVAGVSKRGPKPRLDITTAIVDCVRAWQAATGKRIGVWRSPGTDEEAVACTMARAVLSVLGGPELGDLHRQVTTARQVLRKSH